MQVNNIYHVINEHGELIEHNREDERLKEHLTEIRVSHAYIVNQFEELQRFEPMHLFDEFKEDAEQKINEIMALQGELYTNEGKRAEIRQQIQELSKKYMEKADNFHMQYEEKYENLLDMIDKNIMSAESLTADEVAKISLRNDELLAEIKGKLYTITNTRDLEHEFKQLAKKTKHDESLARFLSKQYYLFMDRAQELDTSEMDKQRAIHQIKLLADKVKEESYSKKEMALYVLRERLRNKTFNVTAPKRNIDQHTNVYLRQYS